MNDIVKIVEEIIRNNVDDLPLHETVVNDRIVLDKKNRIYKKISSINIPKHDIIISRMTRELFKGRFIFQKRDYVNQTYFLKYKNDSIPISEKEYQLLDGIWYSAVLEKRNQKEHEDMMTWVL